MKALTSLVALLLTLLPVSAEIVINEIHYDPEPKTDLAEYVELLNTGSEAIDLSGWQFTNGFDYTFPQGATLEAGAYLILAQNFNGYQKKFGSIFVGGLKAFAGFDSGRLSNNGERIVLRNAAREIMDEVDYQVGFPWPTASQGESIQANGDGVSMELLHPSLDNDLGGSWRAGTIPTPGKENSVHTEPNLIPPHIRQVDHSPRAPRSGDPVIISAKVTDPDGVANVVLGYQHLEPGDYIRLTDDRYTTDWDDLIMVDDGSGPDETANDGIFSVAMPEALQQHRHLIRYRITVEDTAGNALQAPYGDDPQPNFAYFVYDGVPAWKGAVDPGETPEITFSAETMNSIAVYHLIADNGDIEAQQWGSSDRNWYGTVVYEDDIYDHMTFSKRGRASRGQVGKEKWDWNFKRGHRFKGRNNYGERYDVDWREINVLPG
ncbi:MAG: lamin tail domain-containing protein, partial [Verrucomicrobiota bacterium]